MKCVGDSTKSEQIRREYSIGCTFVQDSDFGCVKMSRRPDLVLNAALLVILQGYPAQTLHHREFAGLGIGQIDFASTHGLDIHDQVNKAE